MGRVFLTTITITALGGSAALGLWHMHRQVREQLALPGTPIRIVLKGLPQWMPEQTAEQIARSILPDNTPSALDATLLRQVEQTLAASPWVRRVTRVRRVWSEGPGDTLEIEADYRIPTAVVAAGQQYVAVDTEGYQLPLAAPTGARPPFMETVDGRLVLRVIDGVAAGAPVVGRPWAGEDLRAGLDVAGVLINRPAADEIERIDVSNFRGRQRPHDPQITLQTRYGSRIYWGEPIALPFHAEVSPAQKLERLERIVSRYGRVDAGYPWLDIRLDRVLYPAGQITASR
jgi:hypothetical protein